MGIILKSTDILMVKKIKKKRPTKIVAKKTAKSAKAQPRRKKGKNTSEKSGSQTTRKKVGIVKTTKVRYSEGERSKPTTPQASKHHESRIFGKTQVPKNSKLLFVKAEAKDEIKAIYQYNLDAFTDSPDFKWTLDDIHNEIGEGWELFSVMYKDEIISALFIKRDTDGLKTKNTAIKMHYQGSGRSHLIKEFFERKAKELGVKRIYHYCRIDNFRTYSLNESHGYKKTGRKLANPYLVEWVKEI